MAHQYTTDALVLGTRESGEASSTLILYTRTFGLIYGSAKSLRMGKSKLSALLQTTSLGSVSLVRGKRSWKVVGGMERVNAFYFLSLYPERKALMIRILKLVRRLVLGEEKNETLFNVLEEFIKHITFLNPSDAELPALERLVALRILASLGYTTLAPELQSCISESAITSDALTLVGEKHLLATQEINRALKEAQL